MSDDTQLLCTPPEGTEGPVGIPVWKDSLDFQAAYLGVSVSFAKLCFSNKQSPQISETHNSKGLFGACRLLQLCSTCPFHPGPSAEGAASM